MIDSLGESLSSLAASRTSAAGLGEQAEDSDSRYEQVELLDHSRYPGLIESEDDDWLTLIRIQSPRGQQMHLVIQPFDRSQILSVSRLDAGKRAALAQQIEEFRNRATIEAVRMEALRLEPREAEGYDYRHYRSKWFTLDSTADEQNTRRVIVRAEQIFAAYRQIVAAAHRACSASAADRARVDGRVPVAAGQAGAEDRRSRIRPASSKTRTWSSSAATLPGWPPSPARLPHRTPNCARISATWRARLAERLRVVADSLRKSGLANGEITRELTREREKFKRQLDKKRDELRQSDQQIDHLFKRSASQTLVRLYHEAFHAYLRNNVYPRQKYDVPPWLNEGLAVIFEGGLLEGNTLRVDAPNPLTLKKLKADLAGPAPLELEKLLAAGEGQFLLVAGARPAAVDRYYVNAWGLAYYLTFEKRLLGSPALEKYLQSANSQVAPAQRFQRWSACPWSSSSTSGGRISARCERRTRPPLHSLQCPQRLCMPSEKMIRRAVAASFMLIFDWPRWRSTNTIGVSPNRAPTRFRRQRISSCREYPRLRMWSKSSLARISVR